MARNNKTRQTTKNQDTSYIEGNTVRWEQAVPVHELPEPRKERERTHEEIMRDRARRQAARRNRQRLLAMNRGYVAFLAVATLICAGICGLYIHMQSNITTHMNAIATLETELSDLKADNDATENRMLLCMRFSVASLSAFRSDNDATENRMQSSMTLDEIKEKAAGLGLVYPASGQIQHYTVNNDDYMNQY